MASIPVEFNLSDFNWPRASAAPGVDITSLFGSGPRPATARPKAVGRKRKAAAAALPRRGQAKRHATLTEGAGAPGPGPAAPVSTVQFEGGRARVPRRQHRANSSKMVVVEYAALDDEQRDLYDSLRAFYAGTGYVENIVYPFGEEFHEVALRLVNCSVTSYTPRHKVRYRVDREGEVHDLGSADAAVFDPSANVVIDLCEEYEAQLKKRWNKRLFDSCRRHERVPWPLADGTVWLTTLGQLNFFRWAIQIRLLRWCRLHREQLTAFLRAQDEEATRNQRRAAAEHRRPVRKRRADPAAAPASVHVYSVPLTVAAWVP